MPLLRKQDYLECLGVSMPSRFSPVRLLANPWIVVCQDPLSMEFSRQEYWSGLPFPSPGDLPNLGIEPKSPTLQADSLPSEPPGKPNICTSSCRGPAPADPGYSKGRQLRQLFKYSSKI